MAVLTGALGATALLATARIAACGRRRTRDSLTISGTELCERVDAVGLSQVHSDPDGAVAVCCGGDSPDVCAEEDLRHYDRWALQAALGCEEGACSISFGSTIGEGEAVEECSGAYTEVQCAPPSSGRPDGRRRCQRRDRVGAPRTARTGGDAHDSLEERSLPGQRDLGVAPALRGVGGL